MGSCFLFRFRVSCRQTCKFMGALPICGLFLSDVCMPSMMGLGSRRESGVVVIWTAGACGGGVVEVVVVLVQRSCGDRH